MEITEPKKMSKSPTKLLSPQSAWEGRKYLTLVICDLHLFFSQSIQILSRDCDIIKIQVILEVKENSNKNVRNYAIINNTAREGVNLKKYVKHIVEYCLGHDDLPL